MEYSPSYLMLSLKELEKRATASAEHLSSCRLCPWNCQADRVGGELGHCRAPATAVVSSYSPHFGEEPQLVGYRGSGTIFFTHCNLDCIFCQNWEISQDGQGRKVSTDFLVRFMLELQEIGCHNINFVTPTPYVTHILQALPPAVEQGLKLPLVYNCGGYESLETLQMLEDIFDIYMPDFKYWDREIARAYSGPPDYPERAREALKEMHRQVGDLKTDHDGIAYRGLLVRHLVLPENLAGSKEFVNFLAKEISPRCAVNIMRQYFPSYKARGFPPLDRPVTAREYREARKLAEEAGLRILK